MVNRLYANKQISNWTGFMNKETRGIGNLFANEEFDQQSVLDNISDSICRFLPDGALTFVNQEFCNLAQRTRQESCVCGL